MSRNPYLPFIFFLLFIIISGLYWLFNPVLTVSNLVCYFFLLAGLVLIGGTVYYRLQPPPRRGQARPANPPYQRAGVGPRFKAIKPGSKETRQNRAFHIPRETNSSQSDAKK